MKKIVFTSSTAWYVYNFRLNTVLEMIDRGHSVYVVSPYDEYVEKLEKHNVKHIKLRMNRSGLNPLYDVLTFFNMLYIYFMLRPNIVFNFTPKCNIYSAMAARPFTINIFNNMSGLGSGFNGNKFVYYITYILYQVSQRFAKKIFFQNNDDLDFFVSRGLVKLDRTCRLPGSGVDLEKFYFSERKYSSRRIKFIFCGRFLKSKGVELFFDSATIINRIHPEAAEFNLVGFIDPSSKDGITQETLDSWIESKNINYLGVTDNVVQHLTNTDCIVLPSFYAEGVPKSLLEANACGSAVITTNNVGCKDAVIDNITGYLIDKQSLDSLVVAIENYISLFDDEKYQMSLACRKLAEKMFDEKIVINKYLELLD
ncbi:glycosyltransferase family 4 protein [Vibrio splendidus]|uniref:glycosyltransferase family 4 protein n=1 Tax=Vibrio splendidus TaxID=29497 RepID=UPI000D38D44A|nr:glycosyltransferase family 4 protein [Vibrio splendidus]PTO85994.1 glycosyltransferase family 1 protein [Vibrio splendidus]